MFVTENKHTLPIKLNLELVYKNIGHGAVVLTKDDVECRGSTFNLGGKIHDGVITYDITTVLVLVEVGKDKVVNLEDNPRVDRQGDSVLMDWMHLCSKHTSLSSVRKYP